MMSKWNQNPGKIGPGTQQKTDLKIRASKIKKYSKNDPKWIHKSERIFGEMPLGAPLVVQTAFVMKKLAPSAPKVRPKIETWATNHPREPIGCEKELQKEPRMWKKTPKVTLFGSRPGGLREASPTPRRGAGWTRWYRSPSKKERSGLLTSWSMPRFARQMAAKLFAWTLQSVPQPHGPHRSFPMECGSR